MSVSIVTPFYGAQEAEASISFAGLCASVADAGWSWTWDIEARDPNCPRARNVLMHRFLQSGHDWMLCIDKDTVFTPNDAFALMQSGEDVVSSCCKKKFLDAETVGHPMEERQGDLLEMHRIGFGMVAVSRHAALRLTEACGGRVFSVDTGKSQGQIVAEVFATELKEGRFMAIDDVFSDRWRALGGRLWMHLGVRVGHVGAHVYL